MMDDDAVEVKCELLSDSEEEEVKNLQLDIKPNEIEKVIDYKERYVTRHRNRPSNLVTCKKHKAWTCKKCHETLPTNRLLREHRKVHRPSEEESRPAYKYDEDQEIFTCNTCDAECATVEEIKRHLKVHEITYNCEICSKSFTKPYNYATHMYQHSKDKTFRCPLCKYSTSRRTALLTHINCMHLQKYPYICHLCGKGFTDPVFYKEHENEHLGLKPFICIVCNKGFSFSRYLTSHQVRSHRVFIEGKLLPNQCNVCFRIFAKLETMEKHLIRQHEKISGPHEKKHLCDICGQGFSRVDKLKIHYRIHTGIKPYSCSYCTKSFIKRDYLVMHERVHSGEKPYSCKYCGRCFNQGAPLRIHLRSHTGERPYRCHICDTGYVSRGALNVHFKTCPGQGS